MERTPSELPVFAYGFAGTFAVRDLPQCFPTATLRPHKTHVVAHYTPTSVAVAFDFGAVVFVDVDAVERTRVLEALRTHVAVDEPHPPLEDHFVVELRPDAPAHGQVRFDRVVVPALTPELVEVLAELLAQSVSLDYYEEDLRPILARFDETTDHMSARGVVPRARREFTRFVGRSMAARNQIIAGLALLDKPAVTWESEPVDRLYRGLRSMLEIDDRFQALEYKLRTVQDTLVLLLDLMQSRRMLFLETTIVALILLELVVMGMQHG